MTTVTENQMWDSCDIPHEHKSSGRRGFLTDYDLLLLKFIPNEKQLLAMSIPERANAKEKLFGYEDYPMEILK